MYRYDHDSFCRTMIINEALFGQKEEQLKMMIDEIGISLDFDFSDMYVFLTGIPKKLYVSYLDISRVEYKIVYERFINLVEDIKQKHNLNLIHAVLNYNQSKQIVILIKKGELSEYNIFQFCSYLSNQLQFFYTTIRNFENVNLANYSVISEYIPSYSSLSHAFIKTLNVAKLAYFDMKTKCVLVKTATVESIDKSLINSYINDISDDILALSTNNANLKVRELFALLKHNQNFDDLDYAINLLNNSLQTLLSTFSISDFVKLPLPIKYYDDSCLEETKKKIEYCVNTIQSCLAGSIENKQSTITQSVLLWLKSNYFLNIGLQDAADNLGLNPSYVSRTFSHDMNCSFSSYLAKYRIEIAKIQLVNSDEKIAAIAKNVGFSNSDYFCAVFKKETGMSPLQYRKYYE